MTLLVSSFDALPLRIELALLQTGALTRHTCRGARRVRYLRPRGFSLTLDTSVLHTAAFRGPQTAVELLTKLLKEHGDAVSAPLLTKIETLERRLEGLDVRPSAPESTATVSLSAASTEALTAALAEVLAAAFSKALAASKAEDLARSMRFNPSCESYWHSRGFAEPPWTLPEFQGSSLSTSGSWPSFIAACNSYEYNTRCGSIGYGVGTSDPFAKVKNLSSEGCKMLRTWCETGTMLS